MNADGEDAVMDTAPWITWTVGPERPSPLAYRAARVPDPPDQRALERLLGVLRADLAAACGRVGGGRWVRWAVHTELVPLGNAHRRELPDSAADPAGFDAAMDELVGRIGVALVTADHPRDALVRPYLTADQAFDARRRVRRWWRTDPVVAQRRRPAAGRAPAA
jgi:hypothetical protein